MSISNTDQNLEFITEKIMQIKTALCVIEHEMFPVKTHIIQILYADKEGNIYFNMIKPLIGTEEIKKFAVNLTFYRKNFDYYIQLKAIATIENDDNIDEHNMILKAKIMKVDYVEHAKPFTSHSVVENLKHGVSKFARSFAMMFY